MYIEDLYNIVDDCKISKKELNEFKAVIRRAGFQYLLEQYKGTLKDTMAFTIEDWYITDNNIFSELGIGVYPYTEELQDTGLGDRQDSDNNSFIIHKNYTIVDFPTRLFSKDKYSDVKRKFNRLRKY